MRRVLSKISLVAGLPIAVAASGCANMPASGDLRQTAALAEASGGTANAGGESSSTQNLLRLAGDIEARGSVATALPLYERAAADPNASADINVALGDAYAKLNRDNEAADAYRKALEKSPNHGRALLGLGSLLVRGGQTSAGLDLLVKAAPLVNTAEAYDRLGVAHIVAGQPREALASFEQAYSFNAKDADIATNVALAAALMGQQGRAVAVARQTLTYAGLKPYHRRNLILALAVSGEVDEARETAGSGVDPAELNGLLDRAEQIRQLESPKDRALALGTIRLAAARQ